MSTLESYLLAAANAAGSQFWLDVAAKATALLLAAIAASALLRRSSAALRHRVWCLTFAALVLLPGLSAALPKWRLAILPVEGQSAPEAIVANAPPAPPAPFVGQTASPRAEQAFFEPPPDRGEFAAELTAPAQSLPSAPVPSVSEELPSDSTASRQLSSAATIWLLGAALALAPLALGLVRMFVLRRQSRAVDNAAWIGLLDEVRARLGLARRVELLETHRAVMPMTWGLLRPAVLLPAQSREWSDRLRRIVLLHELAHVKRYDVGFQLLGRLTCALYWFHPLAWYALRRLRIERELACDDCVVHAGELASDYASELLQIARAYGPLPLAAAIAMAQRSSLEHRIRALFDRACSHLPISARAARLLLAGVAILVTTVAAVRLAPRAKAEDDQPIASENAKSQDDDLVTVAGRVVDPQGNPAAGATVFAVRWYSEPHIPHPALADTTSGADGRFTISFRKSQFNVDLHRPEQWKEAMIVATAEGAGAGWVTWRDILPGVEPTLTLAADVPITCRIVDTEGKPVGGVSVRVGSICAGKDGNLDGWLAAVRNGEFRWTAARHFEDDELPQFDAWPPRAATGNDGRFRIDGIGRERKVELSFAGPTIAYQRAAVVTRKSETLQLKISTMPDESTPVYGADFELVAPPTQAIVGVVRDAATREPLAGVSIESNRFAGSNYVNERHLLAVSNDRGRYRLVGMPKGAGNQLLAVSNDEQPYLMRDVDVPESRGLESIEVDIELHRGVWITGRVTDRATGEPLVAWLHYWPFLSNEYARQTPEFGTPPGSADGYENRYVSRPDGSFRLVGLPGRAIVGALCVTGHYRDGVGAESIEGINERGHFDTYPNPVMPGKKWPHAMKEINPAADAESVVCDLTLDPGGKIAVNVLDREGKSLEDFEAEGVHSLPWSPWSANGRSRFEVINLGPDETRTVIIRHKSRKLGKVVRLRLADHPTGATTVSLEPTAKIVGRLLDANGEPISGAEITALLLPSGDFSKRLRPIATDEQGRFKYSDIPIGCHYQLQATASALRGQIAKDLAVAAGETNDLGDVAIGGDKATQERPAAGAKETVPRSRTSNENAASNELSADDAAGAERRLAVRVVDAAGKPIASARVRVIRYDTHPAFVERVHAVGEARTDDGGAARVAFPVAAPFAAAEVFVTPYFFVLAEADGYALDWSQVPSDGDVTIALSSDDVPVEGRVLDLEGRPRSGVRVSILSIQGDAENIEAWIEAAKHNPTAVDPLELAESMEIKIARFPGRKSISLAPAPVLPVAVTDAQGRFRFAGLGRDRMLMLELSGDGMAKTWLNVVTRDMPAAPYSEWGDPRFRVQTCFGAKFVLTAEPEQPIAGVVRDAESGRPLVGAEVRLNQYADSMMFVEGFLAAKTDEQGRYVLRGVPKPHDRERSHRLRVVPGADQPYFRTAFEVAKRDGFEPVPCDVELKRAVWLRGRVTDETTSKPIQGLVEYYPFLSNEAAANYANFDPGARSIEGDRYATDENGVYRLPALPGRGVVAFIANETERYPEADGADAIADLRQQGKPRLNVYHLAGPEFATALREANPPAEAREAVCDISLRSLGVARVELVDPDRRALTGVVARRLAPQRTAGNKGYYQGWPSDPLPEAKAEIIGPRDQPRTAMFLHRERKLAAALRLTRDSDPPRKIVLRPYATLTGRVVDRERKPVPNLFVLIGAKPDPGAKPLPGWAWESIYSNHQLERLPTGQDGKFRVDIVPPGVEYVIIARRGAERLEATTLVVPPGQALDLGDLVLQEPKADEKAQTKAPAAKPKPAAVAPAGEAEAAKTEAPDSSPKATGLTTLRGHVLDPDGKPLAGAKVYLSYPARGQLESELLGASNAEGAFEFHFDTSKFDRSHGDPWNYTRLTATAPGYGFELIDAAEAATADGCTLQLVKDLPIHGRILTLEGKPALGAKVRLRHVLIPSAHNLDDYIEARLAGRAYHVDRPVSKVPGVPESADVDDEGRFMLEGYGAERLVNLEVEGPGIEYWPIDVMTRETEPVVRPTTISLPRPDRAYGATFDHLAAPARTIVGVVRQRGSGQPIAGVKIDSRQTMDRTTTDAEGRFELLGAPKAKSYLVDAKAENLPYFSAQLRIADTPGLDPIQVEIELDRGVAVAGRVSVRESGEPNPAFVEYLPLEGNSHIARLGRSIGQPCASAVCDAKGRYAIPVLPGPGVLCFRGAPWRDAYTVYMPADVSIQQIDDFYKSVGLQRPTDIGEGLLPTAPLAVGVEPPLGYNQVVFINPSEDEQSLAIDAQIPIGGVVKGTVLDPDGQPLPGAEILGLSNSHFEERKLETAEFEVAALNPRQERTLLVRDRARNLAAYRLLRGDEPGPIEMRLQTCGSLIGRLLDEDGEPVAKTQLGLGRPHHSPEFTPFTDADGRFRVDAVAPGMEYEITIPEPGRIGLTLATVVVVPGETKDVGDLRLKPPRMAARPSAASTLGKGQEKPNTGAETQRPASAASK
ncbi:MAG TPA: carboxypeptidase regulatory-like domain-containing protein [Pirellulales bacterium]|nr:carboxypeptidase regulatory-like domain-containing protein [Pirellulales bacterium]